MPGNVTSRGLNTMTEKKTPKSRLSARAASPKPRSLSEAPKPTLSPSPAFREPASRVSKDDTAVINPSTPRRTNTHARGLSLQMPTKETLDPSTAFPTSRGPPSPKLDTAYSYGSPSPMLPRRSRGMDFTRACTNLHLSTLATSSPEASPTIGVKGILIPQRRSLGSSILDSPSNISSSLWSSMPGAEKTVLSSSVSSVNMLDSDSDSDSDFEDMAIDRDAEDPILNTPGMNRLNGILMNSNLGSPGGESLAAFTSPGQSNFHSFTRARLRGGTKLKSRHSSSSASLHSAKPSPGPLSPRLVQSIETNNSGYFGMGLTKKQVQSRRESLSLGTDLLHLSDSEDNESKPGEKSSSGVNTDSPRVIRRAVTRRSNMLPKPKNFARIRAALLEESAPVENELKREAEVIRQVHENEPSLSSDPSPIIPSAPFTGEPEASADELGLPSEESGASQLSLPASNFGQHAERNSAGLGFWNAFDDRYRTPPPQLFPRESSSTLSDEAIEMSGSTNVISTIENPALMHLNRSRSRSRSTTPMPSNPPTAGDIARKINNKRRRDEDFDPAAFKRRAVSPGLSVQSSPVLPQSPTLTNERAWGRPPPKQQDRSNSGGSISNGVKKVGLQGMTETNDSLMNMSID